MNTIPIPFVGAAYAVRSIPVSSQVCINMYLEVAEDEAKTPVALLPTPGLLRKLLITGEEPTGPIRGMCVHGGKLYVVSGRGVYAVNSGFKATHVGNITSGGGRVAMASNGVELCLVDGSRGYLISSDGIAQITDEDFPNGVRCVVCADSWFIVSGDGSGKFYKSAALDGGTWDGTEFASAESSPDELLAVVWDHSELVMLGSESGEFWVNSGNGDFPFERSGSAIETGCAARFSAAKLDNSILWLGKDERGSGIVWRVVGHNPVRISTHAIEHAIAGYSRIDDAFAYAYQQEGHQFYVLTFPSADATWVYDAATQKWHQRTHFDCQTGEEHRHRSNCHAFFAGKQVVGDWEKPILYILDLDTHQDDGCIIKRTRRTVTMSQAEERLFFGSLQVQCETGNGMAGLAPVARFSADPLSGPSLLDVTAIDESFNCPTTWQWVFASDNDTITTYGKDPAVGLTAGTYDVTLTVSNDFGASTLTKSAYIAVSGGV